MTQNFQYIQSQFFFILTISLCEIKGKIYKLPLKIVIYSQDNVIVLYKINYVGWFYYGPNDIKLNV